MDDVRSVEEDFVRACPGPLEAAKVVLADALRRWRDCVSGGLDRSFFAGSESVVVGGFGRRPEDDLCNPPATGLPMFARAGGGRIEELLITLPVALGGLEMVRVGGLGSRLGDCPVLSGREIAVPPPGSIAVRSYLLPASAGLRRDRVLEGSADMVSDEVQGCFVDAPAEVMSTGPFDQGVILRGPRPRQAERHPMFLPNRTPSLWHKPIDMIYTSILQFIIGLQD